MSKRRSHVLPWIVPLHRRLADARCFTARGLSAQLRRAGLEPVAVDYVNEAFNNEALAKLPPSAARRLVALADQPVLQRLIGLT